VEIMLKWLECGNWGQAFLSVIPKRKGGRLIGSEAAGSEATVEENEDDGEDGGGEEEALEGNAADVDALPDTVGEDKVG